MITKIQGEAPFQVLTNNFSISPSKEGYTLQISADGVNYSNLFSVGANVTRLVTGVAANSYYRLLGNNSEVSINWMKTCVTEGGGGSTYTAGEYISIDQDIISVTGITPDLYLTTADTQDFATQADITAATSPIQEQLDDVERVTASALTELHQNVLDLSGATSNYYTKNETDTQIADAIADIPQPDLSNYYTKDQIGVKEEVVSRALNDLHNDVLDLSGATPDLSAYWTSAQTKDAISAATSRKANAASVEGDWGIPRWNSQGIIIGKTGRAYSKVSQINGANFYVYSDETNPFPNIYAPTAAGTAGQILVSAGSGAPVWTNDNKVSSTSVSTIVKLTQAEYDAITTPDASTLYIITNS